MPHIHEKYDFTVGIFIVFDNKVLMVNHPRYDLWLAPGGHVELDEDTDETLFREIKEETGYKAHEVEVLSEKPQINSSDRGFKALFTPNFMDVHEANAPHRHIALVYFVRAKHGKYTKSNEHTEAEWLSMSEIESGKYNIPADVKFFAKEAIKTAAQN
jgi:8-oxo-dGTP pyrophosphatase MutT (NUDIX family)